MRVLVVDDEFVSRKKLQKIIESICDCEAVENGEDALKLAVSENPPDLIILDIMMDGMNGYDLCKRLKTDRKTLSIPIIFISGKSESEDEAKGLALGGADYITKPFSPAIVKARVQTQLDLKKHRDHLEDIIRERTAELERTHVQLQQVQKMEALGTLAGGIAHDFNNILFPILGYSEMAMMQIQAGSNVLPEIKGILKAANRAKDLVQQILTFSRREDEELKPLKIQFVLKETVKLLRASLPANIEILQKIDTDCGPILTNTTQIQQVVMNLCTNAFHAMRNKSGVLEVTLAEAEFGFGDPVPETDMQPGQYLKLTISDTGEGMDHKVMETLFDPFFTTKGPGEGTGLGLSVVHGIIKRHNGHICVNSKVGAGTIFHIYLPLLDVAEEISELIPDEFAKTGKEHILLVDDEDQIVSAEKQMLEALGYRVTAQTSSAEILDAFNANPDIFDLVITDLVMPQMSGMELAQELLNIRPDIPIILCTGFSAEITEEKAKALGIREYIFKPIGMVEISEVIRNVLDH